MLPLLFRQISMEADLHAKAMDVAALRDAVGAILRVLAIVNDGDVDAGQRKLLARRVVVQRHRRATAEGRAEEVVWRGTFASAAGVDRLVHHEPMWSSLDFVAKGSLRMQR